MRPYRKVQIAPEKPHIIQIIQSYPRSPPISRFKRLVIFGLIILFIASIVIPFISLRETNSLTISLSTSSIPSNITPANAMLTNINTNTFENELTSIETPTLTENLILNPGAESQFDHWQQIGDSPVLIDSNGSFHTGYYPHSGNYCFIGGFSKLGSQSRLGQTIELVNLTSEQIDSGELQVTISFYYQTWFSFNRTGDHVEIDVIFLTKSLNILGRIHTGELICRQWCHYIQSFPLPSATRMIYYIMIFSNNDQLDTNIDVYLDDHSLMIS